MASKRLRHVLKVFSSVGLLSYREKHLPKTNRQHLSSYAKPLSNWDLVLLKLVKSYPHALTFCQRPISENYQNSRAQFLP